MIRIVVPVVCCALIVPAVLVGVVAAAADKNEEKQVDPRKASLAEAVEDWVGLLEADTAEASDAAAERWAKDKDATEAVKKLWPTLRDRHAEFDYRTWIAGDGRAGTAEKIGDATEFTVGGHDFGHLHVRWTKTGAGWRIERVFECR